jgi:hypothetical protein
MHASRQRLPRKAVSRRARPYPHLRKFIKVRKAHRYIIIIITMTSNSSGFAKDFRLGVKKQK